MNEWRGVLSWPIDTDWVCETCGDKPFLLGDSVLSGLTWGLVHGVCRCDQCHTQYAMRDVDKGDARVMRPICLLKPEYKEAAKCGWQKFGVPLSEFSDAMWDELLREKG